MMTIDKIRDEMAKKHDHPGVAMIGEYVSERVLQGASVQEGKTLEGAFAEIRKYAKENRTGNFAFVPPAKAYEIVDKYFGFSAKEEKPVEVVAMPKDTMDDLDLDKMLWG